MKAEKTIEVIEKLIHDTKNGRLIWRPTARVNEFTSYYGDRSSVLVRKDASGSCDIRWVDVNGHELRRISEPELISDWLAKSGDSDSIGKMVSKPDALMSDLFDAVRSHTPYADQAVDDVL